MDIEQMIISIGDVVQISPEYHDQAYHLTLGLVSAKKEQGVEIMIDIPYPAKSKVYLFLEWGMFVKIGKPDYIPEDLLNEDICLP